MAAPEGGRVACGSRPSRSGAVLSSDSDPVVMEASTGLGACFQIGAVQKEDGEQSAD